MSTEATALTWRNPATYPDEHGAPALLALHVMENNTAAGIDEFYRLAWWDAHRGVWQYVDAEEWAVDTSSPADPWLLGWVPLTHPQVHGAPVQEVGDGQ